MFTANSTTQSCPTYKSKPSVHSKIEIILDTMYESYEETISSKQAFRPHAHDHHLKTKDVKE